MLLVTLVASGTLMALAGFGLYELYAQDQALLATSAVIAVLMALIYSWYLVLTAPLDDSAQ